jgi:hypothetical protein
MTMHPTANRPFVDSREPAERDPVRLGEELEGAFSPNLVRDQFEHLFRQFGR